MSFHHGVDTKRVKGGSSPVAVADTAIIAIVGTAPKGEINKLTLCQTPKDFAQFGDASEENSAYTLPKALEIIARYKAGKVYVVNVGKLNKDDEATPTAIIGGFDGETQRNTGMFCFKEGFTRFGTDAKIILAPEFDANSTVAAAMETMAEQIKAIAYINLPKGISLQKAVQGRGSEGDINAQSSSNRVHLFYPHVKRGAELESLATHAAGLRCKVDADEGYWFSTSNHNLQGVTGVEFKLTARLDDKQSETNVLNGVGITTVFNSFGTGFRLWGNRTAQYPTNQHISNFEVATRVDDVVVESITKASLPYVDKPIDKALADSLIETVSTFLRNLPSLVGFSCSLDYDEDLVDAFSQGRVPIAYDHTPKLPAELIAYKDTMTRKYLINLTK